MGDPSLTTPLHTDCCLQLGSLTGPDAWQRSERTAGAWAARRQCVKAGEGQEQWFLLAAAQVNVGG